MILLPHSLCGESRYALAPTESWDLRKQEDLKGFIYGRRKKLSLYFINPGKDGSNDGEIGRAHV